MKLPGCTELSFIACDRLRKMCDGFSFVPRGTKKLVKRD